MSRELPIGTLTFLFTDVEGSTKLLHELGAEPYAEALARHRRVLREAFAAHGGVEVDTQGDAFFYVFPRAPEAAKAAAAATEALGSGPVRVRIGVHTGTAQVTEEGYVGEAVHLGARIAAAGHGGQVLLSKETRELVEGELTDLGEHRVKDFAEPVWIFQLGSGRFPPLKTISNTNLPRPASSFVGRGREVAEVAALLRDRARLVTLSGPGGSGKTRLAIEAASELVSEFKSGVFWVGLAALRDPALVSETVAETLGAKDGLVEHIGEREMLLLLDNLEQVVEAAPELAALVEACPNLRLLATSRELLRVRGEVEYAVPPLAELDAVELFCARARLEPSDEIAALCRRLDSLPLAVELAASRTSVLSPAQILDRLSQRLDLLRGGRDAEARQQTLRATIEWSHELLNSNEERLFARLAVFAGGCTLDAAEDVCEADLNVLQSLVDKSLLRHTGERFWMLETIREYAAERLRAAREADEVRRRHAGYFSTLAEQTEPHVERDPEAVLTPLETENDNFRSALDWLEASGELQDALRLAGALAPFWETRHLAEGAQRFESLLSRDPQPTAARAKALLGAALMARQSGDVPRAKGRAMEALALYRELGDTPGTAKSDVMLGLAVADEGDFSRARQLFEDSAQRFSDAGAQDDALFATRLLGWMLEELGDLVRARAVHEDNLRRARELSNRQIEGQTLGALAVLAIAEGRAPEAVPMLEEVLRIDRERNVTLQTALDLTRFARALAHAGGAPDDAARILSSAEAIRDKIGAGTPPPYLITAHEDALAVIRTQLDESALAAAREEGQALTVDEALALALGEAD